MTATCSNINLPPIDGETIDGCFSNTNSVPYWSIKVHESIFDEFNERYKRGDIYVFEALPPLDKWLMNQVDNRLIEFIYK